jgi:hypothetical protein
MAIQKSPHTQSEQNVSFEQTDLDPDLERKLAEGDESQLPQTGGQMGGTRSPRHAPRPGPEHITEPEAVARVGSLRTRTPGEAKKQGISSQSSKEENGRQKRVVKARDEAKAGVKHGGKRAA